MKTHFSNKRNRALTIIEVLVSIMAVCLLAAVALADVLDSQMEDQNKACINNLKQIGLAYKIWEGDNGDEFPQHVSAKRGGAMESAKNGIAYVCFQVMSNELSTPKILICPADTNRFAAENFTTDFGNSKVSYFVGLDASDTDPQTLLSGDDNFEIGGVPVKSGLLELSTNSQISWTAARHNLVGNIGLADGSVQHISTEGLQKSPLQTSLAIP